MATTSIPIDETGQTVAANIRRLRKMRHMRLDDVALLMNYHRRPMSKTTLSQIENGQRRVDVDDLMVLARVLKVNPAALLFPPAFATGETYVKMSGFESWHDRRAVDRWNSGLEPIDPPEPPSSIEGVDWVGWVTVDLQRAAIDDEDAPNRKRADG